MAYYALVNNAYTVVNIIVADEEFLSTPWAQELAQTGQWVAYSEDRPARRNDRYYPELDIFMGPKPYPSWQLDPETASWVAPQALPDFQNNYQWNEDLAQWQQLNQPTGHENSLWEFIQSKFPQTPAEDLRPRLSSKLFRASDQQLIGNIYTWGADLGLVKEVAGQITEYYTAPPETITATWVSKDPVTDQIRAYYRYEGDLELSYSLDGQLIQETHLVSSFSQLPQELQTSLANWPDRDQICMYAQTASGMTVEIRV